MTAGRVGATTPPGPAPARSAAGMPAGHPRVSLVLEPTPLHPAERLSGELGVPVLLKRDDLAGTGLGGNKLRGLEYLIADALGQGCDCLVTGAGPQSNWTMLAALACVRHGIEPHVVCYGSSAADEGNMRLHRWLGVDVRFTGDPGRSSVDAGIEAVTAGLPRELTVVDMSTSGPDCALRLGERFDAACDAPVGGSLSEAESGTLAVYAANVSMPYQSPMLYGIS